MLNKDYIYKLFMERDQKPIYIGKWSTIIETKSAGVYYILQYSKSSWVGWTVSKGPFEEIISHGKFGILFINSFDEEMYLVLDGETEFINKLKEMNQQYKVGENDVKKYRISCKNFDDYISSIS